MLGCKKLKPQRALPLPCRSCNFVLVFSVYSRHLSGSIPPPPPPPPSPRSPLVLFLSRLSHRFEEDFPGAVRCALTETHRLPVHLLRSATGLMRAGGLVPLLNRRMRTTQHTPGETASEGKQPGRQALAKSDVFVERASGPAAVPKVYLLSLWL